MTTPRTSSTSARMKVRFPWACTAVSVTPGVYEGEEPAKSTIYFSSPENRPAAEEIGRKLGITNVVESAENAQSNPIVVILRDDYKA